jgi:hypothetical protein
MKMLLKAALSALLALDLTNGAEAAGAYPSPHFNTATFDNLPSFPAGSAANYAIGTSGATVPLLSGANVWSAAQSVVIPGGIWTNTQENMNLSALVGWTGTGQNPFTIFHDHYGGNYTTDAAAFGMYVPSTATVAQANSLGAYITINRAPTVSGFGDVAGYFAAVCAATNCNGFAINPWVTDTAGFAGQHIQAAEFDVNILDSRTIADGVAVYLGGTSNGANAVAFSVQALSGRQWGGAYYSGPSMAYAGLTLSQNAIGVNPSSQLIQLISGGTCAISGTAVSCTGTQYTATIQEDGAGDVKLTTGQAGYNFIVVDPTYGNTALIGHNAVVFYEQTTVPALIDSALASTAGLVCHNSAGGLYAATGTSC